MLPDASTAPRRVTEHTWLSQWHLPRRSGAANDRGAGDTEVVEEVAVVVSAGTAGDPVLTDAAVMHCRRHLGLCPGSAAEDLEVLAENADHGALLQVYLPV